MLTDQPLLGVHRDSKNAPNKNIDPDKPGTHTGPVKRSSFVKMSNVATVENATPKPRQMIAKKYFTFIPSSKPGVFRSFFDAVILNLVMLLAPKH